MQGESGVGDALDAVGRSMYTSRRFSSPHSMAAPGTEDIDPAHISSLGPCWNARSRGRGSHTEGMQRRPSVPADAASSSSCDEAMHPSSSDALLAHHLGRLRPSDSPQILPSEQPGDDWASSCEALPSLPGSPGWMRAREEVERAQPESMRPPRGPASAVRRTSRGSHPPPSEQMAYEPSHAPARRKSGSDASYEGPWPKLYRVQSGDTSDEGSDTAPPMRSWRARPRMQRSPEHSGNISEHSLSPVASSLELSELSSSEIQANSTSSGADGLDLLAEDMMIASDAVNEGALQASSSTRSSLPSIPEDVLQVGDKIGPGLYHDGQVIQLAQTSEGFGAQLHSSIECLEVVSLIGRGSYAAVYLARQVPCPPEVDVCDVGEGAGRGSGGSSFPIPTDLEASTPVSRGTDNASFGASMGRTPRASQMAHGESSDSEGELRHKCRHPAREFAVKCLYKRDLSAEMLDVQRLEATIHQSIPAHPNIITLYLAYETNDWLMLVLEYCPGKDLYFWLEQAYDSDEEQPCRRSRTSSTASESDVDSDAHEARVSSAEALTSPHLLGSTSPNTLLSYRRLCLVSRMFCQMCDAVQFCHDHGVSHRDIKPENFIVQESEHRQGPPCVKLTDFGLATTRAQCSDFGCGSKPYMAFECRHNLTATYDPRQADIWSLGIVLLNLIFRRSPFREPSRQCPSFAAFTVDPVGFLTQAFDGLTSSFACFLICNIFCDVSRGQRRRISAKELSHWARGLPRYLARGDETERGSRGAHTGITSPLGSDRSMSMHSAFSENRHAGPSSRSDRQALTNSATMTVSDQA